MTNFKGTKGKWELCKTYDEMDKPSFSLTSDEGKIAYCYNLQLCCGVQERANANALLISKAPEMLEMLEKVSNILNVDEFLHDTSIRQYFYHQIQEINDLIKEATEL